MSLSLRALLVMVALSGCERITLVVDTRALPPDAGAARDASDAVLPQGDARASEPPDAARLADAASQPLDAAPATDAAGALDAATVSGPFGRPARLSELGTEGMEDDPSLTGDLLEIYFERGHDVWRATRQRAEDPFGAPTLVEQLSTSDRESTPEVSHDGLLMLLASDRGGLSSVDIFSASRTSRDAPWSTPVRVPELSSEQEDLSPGLVAGALRVVLTSSREGGAGAYDLYESTRAGLDAPWSTPRPLSELNTELEETAASLSAAGTELFFSSNRAGSLDGMADLWLSRRDDVSAPFGEPVPVAELNTAFKEHDPWLSPDARVLVFASDRDGDQELYLSTR